jgi:hypothetical protein
MDFINYTFKFKYSVMFTGNMKRSFFTVSLAGVALSLPVSEWLLSVFIFALIVSWITSGGIKRIPLLFNEKKIILLFLGSYLIYMVWMFNSSDLESGLKQLRLKLPLLIFPLVIGLSDPLDRREQKLIIISFLTGVVVSSVAGMIKGYDQAYAGYVDPKMLSPFISHIRLALMSVFAIACSGWYFRYRKSGMWHDWLFPAVAIWLTLFLFLLLSLTGIFLLFLTLAVTSVLFAIHSGSRFVRIVISILLPFSILAASTLIVSAVISFYKPGNAYAFPLKVLTAGGKPYFHNMEIKDRENGNLVWIYLCEEELGREWEKHSLFKFEGLDKKGQSLKYTLIRYMASAGLTKDSSGFASLTSKDTEMIERGMTNRSFLTWKPWKIRLYEIIWQIDYFKRGGNPSGHSITQRLVFFKTGINIFLRHPLFGTGTGDVTLEYREQYEKERSVLDQEHRLLSHNQFLHFMISFGIIGSALIVWSLFYPFIALKQYMRYLPSVFFLLLVISMFWEDTLETHTGVSFFAYFYSVFIFGTEQDGSQDKKK